METQKMEKTQNLTEQTEQTETSLVQTIQIKKGRPFVTEDNFTKVKLAYLASHGVSLALTGKAFAICSSTNPNQLKNLKIPSRNKVVEYLLETHQAVLYYISEKLSSSTDLAIGIDTTSDRTQRELLAISFSGNEKGQLLFFFF